MVSLLVLWAAALALGSAEFLNVTDLTPEVTYPKGFPRGHPPDITLTLPENGGLTVDFSCKPGDIPDSNLEPFRDYTCSGNIRENNRILKSTESVRVDTKCDLRINVKNLTSTNTSISLDWETTTENCDIDLLQQKLTYDCSCSPQGNPSTETTETTETSKRSKSTECTAAGLEAFTEHTCEIKAFYGNEPVTTKSDIKEETKVGEPDGVGVLYASGTDSNSFVVDCYDLHFNPPDIRFRGPQRLFQFTLYFENEKIKQETTTDCRFQFRDLKYDSIYTVEARAFNGELYGPVSSRTTYTDLNLMALLGFVVALHLVMFAAPFVALCKKSSGYDPSVMTSCEYSPSTVTSSACRPSLAVTSCAYRISSVTSSAYTYRAFSNTGDDSE